MQSDTEFEVSQRKEAEQPAGQSWAWGQLPNAPESLTVSLHEDIVAGAAEGKLPPFLPTFSLSLSLSHH